MPCKLIIFDCDGVLVDSEPISNRLFAAALQDLGLEMDEAAVRREFVGLSMDSCMAEVERRLGRPAPDDFVERFLESTHQAFRAELQPVAGVEAVLDGLTDLEVSTCVASSGEPEKIRLSLELTGLARFFDDRLFSASEVPRGKPAPDLFLHAARSMRVPSDQAVVIEDSRPGVQAARAAGMQALGYTARIDPALLRSEGARVFDSMRQLPGLLAEL